MSRLVALLVALALSPLTGCVQFERRAELAVPHMVQESQLCVPTSAAMVLAFYDDPQAPRRLKALSRGRAYDPAAPFDDFTITLFTDMKRGLSTLGYAWNDAAFSDTRAGFSDGMTVIERELMARRPVLVDISHDGVGHTLVIRGFDSVSRELFLLDPAQPAPGAVTVSYDQFEALWNEHTYGGQFRALMTTAPKG